MQNKMNCILSVPIKPKTKQNNANKPGVNAHGYETI